MGKTSWYSGTRAVLSYFLSIFCCKILLSSWKKCFCWVGLVCRWLCPTLCWLYNVVIFGPYFWLLFLRIIFATIFCHNFFAIPSAYLCFFAVYIFLLFMWFCCFTFFIFTRANWKCTLTLFSGEHTRTTNMSNYGAVLFRTVFLFCVIALNYWCFNWNF